MVLVNETVRLLFAVTALVLAAMLTAPIEDEMANTNNIHSNVQVAASKKEDSRKMTKSSVTKKSKKSRRA